MEKAKLERTTTVMTTVSVGAPSCDENLDLPQVILETSSLSNNSSHRLKSDSDSGSGSGCGPARAVS